MIASKGNRKVGEMKARRMLLALAACAAGVFAFGATAAQASPGLTLGHGRSHTNAARPDKKAPKPKIYELCLGLFEGTCFEMEVYTKTHTWNTPDIFWESGEEYLAPFDGTIVKGVKGEVTYTINGPYGEPETGDVTIQVPGSAVCGPAAVCGHEA